MPSLHPLLEGLLAFLILSGVGMNLTAAIGLRRFPDVLTRMHAASKPSMLGVVCVLVAAALALGTLDAFAKLALVAALQLVTTPTGSHMVGRAVWHTEQGDVGFAGPSPQHRD
ncbi:MAG TPA: monovalent cation/H(+) antiporter subunit G [Euzebya sp.]|nr:monovalent cation/H(+) antiporter subunit G [Euzebya sp.]